MLLKSGNLKSCITLSLWLILLALAIPTTLTAQTNTCCLGQSIITGTNSFSVEIILINSDTIAGFQIPFKYSYGETSISCDSISFFRGACENFDFQDIKINNTSKTAYFSAISSEIENGSTNYLAPGRHNLGIAYFSIAEINDNELVTFERGAFQDEERDYSFLFWTPAANAIDIAFDFDGLELR